jgi:hypothetical protein
MALLYAPEVMRSSFWSRSLETAFSEAPRARVNIRANHDIWRGVAFLVVQAAVLSILSEVASIASRQAEGER